MPRLLWLLASAWGAPSEPTEEAAYHDPPRTLEHVDPIGDIAHPGEAMPPPRLGTLARKLIPNDDMSDHTGGADAAIPSRWSALTAQSTANGFHAADPSKDSGVLDRKRDCDRQNAAPRNPLQRCQPLASAPAFCALVDWPVALAGDQEWADFEDDQLSYFFSTEYSAKATLTSGATDAKGSPT